MLKKLLVSILCALTLVASGVDAAVAFRAAGTVSFAGPGTGATPGLPSGFQADDINVAVIMAGNNDTISVPAGWTKKIEQDNSTVHRLTIAWRRAQAGDPTPTFSGNTQDIIAQVIGFSGVVNSGDPFSASGAQANASGTTVTAPAITPLNANEMVIFVGGRSNTGATTSTFSGYSGTNPTFTEAFDNANTAGAVVYDLAIFGAYGIKTDTTSTGSRTATATNAGENTGALLSLIPAGAGGGTVVNPISGRGGAAARPIVRNAPPRLINFHDLLASLRAQTYAETH